MAEENENNPEEEEQSNAAEAAQPSAISGAVRRTTEAKTGETAQGEEGEGPDGEVLPHQQSRFEGAEDGGETDSTLLEDPAYVGVSEEYRNAAYPQSRPMISEDEEAAEAEATAKERELKTAELGAGIGRFGYTPGAVHPSERDPNRNLVAGGDASNTDDDDE